MKLCGRNRHKLNNSRSLLDSVTIEPLGEFGTLASKCGKFSCFPAFLVNGRGAADESTGSHRAIRATGPKLSSAADGLSAGEILHHLVRVGKPGQAQQANDYYLPDHGI